MNTYILRADSNQDIHLILELAKKLKINVMPLSEKEIEEIEDRKLLEIMLEARKEGFADTDEVLRKLAM